MLSLWTWFTPLSPLLKALVIPYFRLWCESFLILTWKFEMGLATSHSKTPKKVFIGPSHSQSSFSSMYKKNLDPPSSTTQQWKKKFEKKINPLPLLLPHVKWRRKKKHKLVPPSPSTVKTFKKKKSRHTPSPWTMNKYNKTIPLALLNNKK